MEGLFEKYNQQILHKLAEATERADLETQRANNATQQAIKANQRADHYKKILEDNGITVDDNIFQKSN